MAIEDEDAELDLQLAVIVHDTVTANNQLLTIFQAAVNTPTPEAASFVVPKAMLKKLVKTFTVNSELLVELYTEYACAMEELEK